MKPVSPVDKTVVAGADPLPRIGGYTIVRLIGHGGAGRVFAAKDEQLGRTVAIKVLHPQVASDPRNVERFLREARAMATISSPHVAAIYQVGQHQGASFIVMEYLEGENLEQRLRRDGRIPLAEALGYARDCARALQAANAAGLVHRDVKPANIVILGERAKLTDFGTARPMDGSADMTMEGQVAGTATFMAPERAMGKGDDLRADIYSLGATLYCLVAGQPPFVRANPIDVISAHLHEDPPPLHESVPGVSPLVQEVLTRMMAKDPRARFQRYGDVITALEDLLGAGGDEGDFEEATEVLEAQAAAPMPTQAAPPATPATTSAVNDPFGPPPSTGGDPFGGPAGGDGGMTGVMGTLKQMSIVDICHMLEMGKKDADIELTALDGTAGRLCLLGGQVTFATWGHLEAEEAFYALARRSEGFFRIHYGRQVSDQNINVPTAFLVLEAMRRLDEASQQQEPAPGPAAPPPPVANVPDLSPDITAPDGAPVGDWPDPFGDSTTGPPSPPSLESLPAPPAAPQRPPPIRPVARSSPPMKPRAPGQSPAPVHLPQAPPPVPKRGHSGHSDTLLMSPEDEAALREQVGRAVPFGQRLETFRETASSQLRALSSQLRALSHQLLSPTASQLAAVCEARPMLAPLASPLRRRPWLLAAAPVAALVVGVLFAAFIAALLPPSGVDGAALARIERGEAPLVLAELEDKPALDRTAQDELLRGHALAALERTDEALGAYRSAAGLGVTDERAVELALSQLAEEYPAAAIDLLAQVPSGEVTRSLLEHGLHDEWNTRHNAVRALEARGEIDKVDLEALAIRDLLEGPACSQRREGLVALKKHGKSEAAREAFQQAYARKDEGNACMLRELEEMAPK